jgi:CrcB protein
MPPTEHSRPTSRPADWLAVGAGGVLGTLLRAGSGLLGAHLPGGGAWITAGGNLLGAFLLGWLSGALAPRSPAGSPAQLFLATGVLGSYTTFSALTVDALRLSENASGWNAPLYLCVSIAGGLLAASLGLAAGRRLPGGEER